MKISIAGLSDKILLRKRTIMKLLIDGTKIN